MKTIPAMKRNILALSVAAIFMGAASLASGASNDGVVQTQGDVSYVSGGVGTESLDKLSAMSADFNLKLVFAQKSGEFLSGVRVVIIDAKGKPILDSKSEGPWFLARLPAGSYQIVGSLDGKTERRQTSVETGKLNTIDFRWNPE